MPLCMFVCFVCFVFLFFCFFVCFFIFALFCFLWRRLMVSCMASSVFLLSFSLLLASSFIYNRIYCFLNTQFFSRMSFTSDRSYFRNGDAFYSIKLSYNLLDEKNNLVYASALNHSQVVVLPKLPHITVCIL